MGLNVSIDISGVQSAFVKAPQIFESEISKGMKVGLTIIQVFARANHRFVTRSADLERSIQTETGKVLKEGKVFLDRGIAIYGRRIHDGFFSWKADRFLFRAAKAKQAEVVNEINKAVARAIIRTGL